MPEIHEQVDTAFQADNSGETLQQALLRLTHPRYAGLLADLENLEGQIADLIADRAKLDATDERQAGEIKKLTDRAIQLNQLIDSVQSGLNEAAGQLNDIRSALRAETAAGLLQVEGAIKKINDDLESTDVMSRRLLPVLVPSIHDRVRDNSRQFAAAISPVIGPAIRHQIRSARQDIIDALYPVIGNIISRAIAEELRTLSRKIDSQLRQQLNFQKRFSNQLARLRGVSAGDLLLRDALPFSIEHVFLVHQETGILLTHEHAAGQVTADPDLIGGMMTAIGDFVKDSFGSGESALEEVTYGQKRILIEAAQFAYIAVVLEGIEPPGFNHLVRAVINTINLNAENELREFNGEMLSLPDFHADLKYIVHPDPDLLAAYNSPEGLDRGQRIFMAGALLGIVILVAGVAFACLYAVRLWPLVFP
jgi:hypothetical protein